MKEKLHLENIKHLQNKYVLVAMKKYFYEKQNKKQTPNPKNFIGIRLP